ncbi:MAG: DoxX family membrane protein [Candidatus Hydrogenedentes bacterium]|nr:DoxX family membrane protein [Candidatus Hydrogenedentota bacterium]
MASSSSESERGIPGWTKAALVLLRFGIGWHFLYEGVTKLADPGWTSAGYLKQSSWVFADMFQAFASDPAMLRAIDLMNMWGLTLIGLGLILGAFTRTASVAGALLLFFYYIANPPFVPVLGSSFEGNYLYIDKNAVEFCALLVLAMIPTGRFAGLDGLLQYWRKHRAEARYLRRSGPVTNPETARAFQRSRRELLQHLAIVPVFGGMLYAYQKKHGWPSFETEHLLDWKARVDGTSSATMKTFHFASLNELKGTVPSASIGNLNLSRMILGGNLIGGWAHARDLIYASDLVKAYHDDARVFATFQMAEKCGINTILTSPRLCRVITDYWHKEGGKIQFISDCSEGTLVEGAQKSIDAGAHACYAQGGVSDRLVLENDFDPIFQMLELTRKNGLPAGIGAHALTTVQACVDKGLKPDFWVKTLHPTDYWSAQIQPEHDNIWCTNPEETIAYMEQREEPWIAFKILAAGAIHPERAFPYAFSSGADFICVGMYDFQLVNNVNLVLNVLGSVTDRKRPWRA